MTVSSTNVKKLRDVLRKSLQLLVFPLICGSLLFIFYKGLKPQTSAQMCEYNGKDHYLSISYQQTYTPETIAKNINFRGLFKLKAQTDHYTLTATKILSAESYEITRDIQHQVTLGKNCSLTIDNEAPYLLKSIIHDLSLDLKTDKSYWYSTQPLVSGSGVFLYHKTNDSQFKRTLKLIHSDNSRIQINVLEATHQIAISHGFISQFDLSEKQQVAIKGTDQKFQTERKLELSSLREDHPILSQAQDLVSQPKNLPPLSPIAIPVPKPHPQRTLEHPSQADPTSLTQQQLLHQFASAEDKIPIFYQLLEIQNPETTTLTLMLDLCQNQDHVVFNVSCFYLAQQQTPDWQETITQLILDKLSSAKTVDVLIGIRMAATVPQFPYIHRIDEFVYHQNENVRMEANAAIIKTSPAQIKELVLNIHTEQSAAVRQHFYEQLRQVDFNPSMDFIDILQTEADSQVRKSIIHWLGAVAPTNHQAKQALYTWYKLEPQVEPKVAIGTYILPR